MSVQKLPPGICFCSGCCSADSSLYLSLYWTLTEGNDSSYDENDCVMLEIHQCNYTSVQIRTELGAYPITHHQTHHWSWMRVENWSYTFLINSAWVMIEIITNRLGGCYIIFTNSGFYFTFFHRMPTQPWTTWYTYDRLIRRHPRFSWITTEPFQRKTCIPYYISIWRVLWEENHR